MDISSLLPPVSAEMLCGPDPESEESVLHKEWTAFRTAYHSDATTGEALHRLRERTCELAKKTKHLQLAVALANCLAQTEGLHGFREGLELVWIWSATWPEDLHPPNDERGDVLRPLARKGEIARWRDEFSKQASDDGMQATANAYACHRLLKQLIALYPWRGEENPYARPDPLRDVLELLEEFQTKWPMDSSPAAQVAPAEVSVPAKLAEPRLTGIPVAALSTRTPASARAHLKERLDELCASIRQDEPSSPVPYLLERAKNCIGKNYVEIAAELRRDLFAETEPPATG